MDAAQHDIIVRGTLPSPSDDGVIHYIAAAPPDYRSSFSGSGLPYASAEQAFYNTPNRGSTRVGVAGGWEVKMVAPSAYYADGGMERVPPTLYLAYMSGGRHVRTSVRVSEGVPFRTLTHDDRRTSAVFYAPGNDGMVRSQEEILRASAFPAVNVMPPDFWGGRPAR